MALRRAAFATATVVFVIALSAVAFAGTLVTRVHVVSPVTAHALASGYRLETTVDGQCQPGSDVLDGPIYRCFTTKLVDGGNVFDPCWRDPTDRAGRDAVCLSTPWDRTLTRIRTVSALATDSDPASITRASPWGLTLAGGVRCVAAQGTHDVIGNPMTGRVVDYGCGDGSVAVLGGLHQAKQPWTADTARYKNASASAVLGPPNVPITDAWYGYAGPASALTLLPFTGLPAAGLALASVLAIAVGTAISLSMINTK